jgi:AcrR family transcriptional regulator
MRKTESIDLLGISRKGRGRPRSLSARSAILRSSLDLVFEKGFGQVTIDEIALRAKVGKPTIYKYWPGKAAVVMDAFFEKIGPGVVFSSEGTALDSIHRQMLALAKVFRGKYGHLIRALLGQAQFDPELAHAFRERWTRPRREDGKRILAKAISRFEIRPDINMEIAIDALWGGMYYRLQVGHGPITDSYVDSLFSTVISGLRPNSSRRRNMS